MLDYFTIYRCILEVIHDEHVTDAFELFEFLSSKEELYEMREIFPKNLMAEATLEVLDNLIDDGLVIAKRLPTSDITLYQIQRLSTAGYSYLHALEKPEIKEKAINFLKTEGMPLTPQSLTKALANLFL